MLNHIFSTEMQPVSETVSLEGGMGEARREMRNEHFHTCIKTSEMLLSCFCSS